MEITSGQPSISVGGYGNGDFFGGNGLMFLAFLAMMGMGGGFFGGNRGPIGPMTGDQAPASSAQLQNAMNFNDLQDQNRDINNNVNNVYHDTVAYVGDKFMTMQQDIDAIRQQTLQCSFDMQKQISDQTLKFSEMMNAQNVLIMQENQKTRDMFVQDKIAAMQAEITNLKADARMSGVFRMPQAYTFNAGPGPFAMAVPPAFPSAVAAGF